MQLPHHYINKQKRKIKTYMYSTLRSRNITDWRPPCGTSQTTHTIRDYVILNWGILHKNNCQVLYECT
jgi:hypothetical protein